MDRPERRPAHPRTRPRAQVPTRSCPCCIFEYSKWSNRDGGVAMTRARVSKRLALAVLACLSEKTMHPYEISTTLRTRGKEKSIKLNYGSLYAVAESLQKHGLIAARETTRDGRRPERTVYEITGAGVEEFEDWLAELLSTPVRDFTSLEAGLSLMPGLPPDEVARLLDDRGVKLRSELRTVDAELAEAAAMHLPELFLVESTYRRHMLQAELAFVTELAQGIRSSAFPGTKTWRRLHELVAGGMSFEEIMADPVGLLGEEGAALRAQQETQNPWPVRQHRPGVHHPSRGHPFRQARSEAHHQR